MGGRNRAPLDAGPRRFIAVHLTLSGWLPQRLFWNVFITVSPGLRFRQPSGVVGEDEQDAGLARSTPDDPTPDPSPNPGEPHRRQLSLVYELLRCGFSLGRADSASRTATIA
jgi:hypothetical protein